HVLRAAHRFPGQTVPGLLRTAGGGRRAARDPHHLLLRCQGDNGRPPHRRRPRAHRWRAGVDREIRLYLALPPPLGGRDRPLAGERTAAMTDHPTEPRGTLTIRTLAMPADTNP